MTASIRRVVTGQDDSGRARVLSDDKASDATTIPDIPGWELAHIWAEPIKSVVPLRSGAPDTEFAPFGPDQGGSQFMVWTLPPETVGENPAGMHKTNSIDYVIVISGVITMVLDDGEEIELRPGDALVQGGVLHHWANRGDIPCLLGVVMIGATRND